MGSTMQLDGILEEIERNPESFRTGYNLNMKDKLVIEPKDIWEVAFIHEIPLEDTIRIGRSFLYKNKRHYNRFQIETWFKKQIDLLRIEFEREPGQDEIIENAKKHQNFERYPLCYTLNFPEKTTFNMENYRANEKLIYWFLANAQKLHPYNYPYFDIICKNSFLEEHSP